MSDDGAKAMIDNRACPHVHMSQETSEEPLYMEFYRTTAAEHGHTLCASLRSRNACPHVARVIRGATLSTLHGNTQENCRGPDCEHTLCASLRSRNACQHFTRATLYGNLQVKMPQTKTAPQTLCEPAQSKRMSRFHKSHFIQKFTGKMPQTRVSTLIKHRPLHLP